MKPAMRHSLGSLKALGGWMSMLFCSCILLMPVQAFAQLPDVSAGQKPESPPGEPAPAMLPHFAEGRFWLSGQSNLIYQTHAGFHAAYSGTNSFQSRYQKSLSRVSTLYTGMQLKRYSEVLLDFEEASGVGLSTTFGIAAFPDLDAVRDPSLSAAPYLSRVVFHQVFSLGHEETEASRGPLSTFSELPKRRLELRAGKFAITDFFDSNSVGSDSHLQFMNWAIDQNGAYDFTADSRGYTWGVHLEYQSPAWGLRFAEALMPGPQLGGPLVWNLHKANTSNAEFELHRGVLRKQAGMVRALGYLNHGNMGIYRDAIAQYLNGKVSKPDIDNHPLQVTAKYGFGINLEQNLNADVTAFGRFGWNDGKIETWSFTEIDRTMSVGIGLQGHRWHRADDRAGIAFAADGISRDHANYLAYGGLGLVLGDGKLHYGREDLTEAYYTMHLWRGIYTGPDLQYVAHPGYNRDRGPVLVPAIRLHVEI